MEMKSHVWNALVPIVNSRLMGATPLQLREKGHDANWQDVQVMIGLLGRAVTDTEIRLINVEVQLHILTDRLNEHTGELP